MFNVRNEDVVVVVVQVPMLEFGHGADIRSECKVETLYLGTEVGTESLCAHNFCKIRPVHCFVLGAKLMFQNGV